MPGTYLRVGAAVTQYRKQDTYGFEYSKDASKDRSIQVQFNDGGKAWIGGNVQWDMPSDQTKALALHQLYGSQYGVDQALIRNAINTAMTLTAPMMSATESYAARRAEFLQMFTDQLENGVYLTQSREDRIRDVITGEIKSVLLVSILKDEHGAPRRVEQSPLKGFDIHIQRPTITHFVYEDKVEAQIQLVRDNTMKIQTQQAEAKMAEQAALTAVKTGEAAAAKAKWDQEAVKATQVTIAERDKAVAELNAQRDKAVAETFAAQQKAVAETAAGRDLEVQKLKALTAEQYKREQILQGEGDSKKRELILAADGALEQKLRALVEINKTWADGFSKYQGQIVPHIVTGSNGATASNGFEMAMQATGLKAMQDLGVTLETKPQTVRK